MTEHQIVKLLVWDEFKTELNRHFQSNTVLGQYQIGYLGEFEQWQLFSPQKSSVWKNCFSRHSSSEEAKAAAQTNYNAAILSALSVSLPSLQEIAEKDARIERLEAALTAAADQLHKVHADAFQQAGGYALLVADGKDFSCFELNRCEEEARKARAALRDTEAGRT